MNWQLMLITYAILVGAISLFTSYITGLLLENKQIAIISFFFLSTAILAAVLAAGLS